MMCKELIEYLSEFEPDEQISIVIGDLQNRVLHKVRKAFLIEGEVAALFFETVESEPMDVI